MRSIFSVLLTSLFILTSCQKANRDFIPYSYAKPFLWGESILGDPGYQNFQILNDTLKLHPLGLGKFAFVNLYNGLRENNEELLTMGRKYVDYLMSDYPFSEESNGALIYNYNADNNELKAGHWHSGMSNSVIALSFLMAHKAFGNPDYLEFAKRAMRGVTNDVLAGGSSIKTHQGVWYLEYASKEKNMENARFVLNGFLYQLLAIRLFEKETGEEEYLRAYEEGRAAFQELSSDFHYSNGEWTFYNLNPRSVEPPHYVIFDLTILDALYSLTNDPLFSAEAEMRRSVLKKHYNLEVSPLSPNENLILFSQVGPPNPYWVDIYETKIRFIKNRKSQEFKLEKPRDFNYPILERCFFLDTMERSEFKEVEIWAHYLSDSVLLFTSSFSEIPYATTPPVRPSYSLKCDFSAEKRNETTALIKNPSGNQVVNRGRMKLALNKPFDSETEKYLGIVISSACEFSTLRVFMSNADGEYISRYYLNDLEPGKDNLVLLSANGFPDLNDISDRSFNNIDLNFYNAIPKSDNPYEVEIKEVVFLRSNYNLYDFLMNRPEMLFKEKDNPGFLY